jgi:hypothetical protein
VDSSGSISSSAAAGGGSKPDLKGFMTKIGADFHKAGGEVARGFQKALDETSKGLQKVAQVGGQHCGQHALTWQIMYLCGLACTGHVPSWAPGLPCAWLVLCIHAPALSVVVELLNVSSWFLSCLLQVLEEVPDRLAPKAGQQQQASLPQYPHPALATLFAAKPSRSSTTATAGHGSSGLSGPPAASSGSSGSLGAAVSADSSMARVGSADGSSGFGSKRGTSPQPMQQAPQAGRKVRASDPTDSMTRSELFAGSPSPRTASGSGEPGSRPGSGSAGANRGALSPAPPPGATVSGLVGPSGGAPRVRTAEEIRQAYGRPQLSKAQVGWGGTGACLTACSGVCCSAMFQHGEYNIPGEHESCAAVRCCWSCCRALQV